MFGPAYVGRKSRAKPINAFARSRVRLFIRRRRLACDQLSVESTVRAIAHSTGAPCSRQLTWAEKAGRSPSNAFARSTVQLSIMTAVERSAFYLAVDNVVDYQKFVISTGAYPDFLPHNSWRRPRMWLSVERETHELHQRHKTQQESGVAKWRDLRFPLQGCSFNGSRGT